ncbi:MAG: VRR-NUC domain-containing protein [Gammaproteobacteria bacterium]|jgi:hypothetical protein|nr:VRR-NUC domain-containing protein [Gammaproteobacteria bacterium]MBT5202919.1 VRR-NUC domain-containing protein [Gammaproteobacteria bacterium]MBT5601655.1 VRR-NUC domain-containing protein [Gammaproteobacteria bacterium]
MVAPAIDPDTNPLYYLDNFRYLVDFVAERYHSLFDDRESLFLRRFAQLPESAQALYVRLAERKGPYFRVDKLDYAEIPGLKASVAELSEHGFVIASGLDQVHIQLHVRNKVELFEIARSAQLSSGQMNRDQLVSLIIDSGVAVPLLEIIRLGYLDVLDRFYLLFFGNSSQKLNELVLHEIGVMRYEDYAIDSTNLFAQRTNVDDALCLNRISRLAKRLGAEIMRATRKPRQSTPVSERVYPLFLSELSTQLDTIIEILPGRPTAKFLSYQYDRLLLRLAGYCERLDKTGVACRLYQLALIPPSREKLARLYLRANDLEALTQLCIAMLADPKTEAEVSFAEKKLAKITANHATDSVVGPVGPMQRVLPEVRYGIKPGFSTVANNEVIKENISFNIDGQASIEAQVITWYGEQGKSAQFVENHLFTGLLGLTCWDIIFAPVPGAFFHPFQRGPADLYSGAFSSQRGLAFERRFEQLLAKGQLIKLITACFQQKYGRINPFVHWRRLELADYCRLAEAIDPVALVSVFHRMLNDPVHHCSGFPDLVVWHEDRFELVEVKGPGDRLQDHQRRWLAYFSHIGLPARVLYVADEDLVSRDSGFEPRSDSVSVDATI